MKFMCATWMMSVPLAMFVVLSTIGFLQTVYASDNMCGCASCTNDVLNAHANAYTCGSRIQYLMQELAFEEYDACARIGGIEFPIACRLCNPKTCDGRGNDDPTGDSSILVSRDNTDSDKNNKSPEPAYYCGCKACTADVWHAMATEYSCGARISYLTDVLKMASPDACTLVAGRQFSDYCGLCDPSRCEAEAINNLSVEMPEEAATPTLDGKLTPVNVYSEEISHDQFVESKLADYMTLTARTSIYCFPDFLDRERYRNMWGRYTVEVKESATLCGPGENRFSTKTVKRMDNDHLKLQFKKIAGQWHGSEVRVRLPESQMPLLYGNYSFSVKSVQVIDSSNNGTVIDTVLPPSLVLGLFTWDATEDYAIHENQNHEVDIEISRWNIPGDKDLQFLVRLMNALRPFLSFSKHAPMLAPFVFRLFNHSRTFFRSNLQGILKRLVSIRAVVLAINKLPESLALIGVQQKSSGTVTTAKVTSTQLGRLSKLALKIMSSVCPQMLRSA